MQHGKRELLINNTTHHAIRAPYRSSFTAGAKRGD
jgi:hypothetical protein